MERQNISNNGDNEVQKAIVDTLLNIYPIVDDRTDILFPPFGKSIPELAIHFDFYEIDKGDITQVLFLGGTRNYKCSFPDRLEINKLVSSDVVCRFIEYLLDDHDVFKSISQYHNCIELVMTINLCDKNMHGISCGDITLKFDFSSHPNCVNMLNDYFRTIIMVFRDKLENTEMFKREFSKYCGVVKSEFINSLSMEQLKEFVSLFNMDDLCRIVTDLPDMRFIQLYEEYQNKEKEKQLTKLLDSK